MTQLWKNTFSKYNQHGAQVDNENQIDYFHFGENLNFLQVGNGCLEFEKEIKNSDITAFTKADDIRLFIIGLAYVSKEG